MRRKNKRGEFSMKRAIFIFFVLILISVPVHTQQNKKIEFSAVGGFNFCKHKFSYPEKFPLPQHDPKLAYSLGAGVNFYLFHKFSLEVEVLYKAKKSELVEFSGLEWGDTFYRYEYLAFPVLVHYQLPFSKFNIFATMGVETSFLLESQLDDKRNNIVQEPIEYIRKSDFQFISGLGLRYKKLSLEFRYGLGFLNLNADKESDLVVKNKGFEFIISYYFL